MVHSHGGSSGRTFPVRWNSGERTQQPLCEMAKTPSCGCSSPPTPPTSTTLKIEQKIVLTEKKGLIHARQAMIEDVSFDWSDAGEQANPKWTHAIRFWNDNRVRSTTVLIDLDSQYIRNHEKDRQRRMADRLANGLKEYFEIVTKDESP